MSFLEEANDHYRAGVLTGKKRDQETVKVYSEMLAILREVFAIESNSNIKREIGDEIGDVLHRLGLVIGSLHM